MARPQADLSGRLHGGTDEARDAASSISIRNLVKHFRREDGTDVRAVDDISLDVPAGDFLVLLGPSGCGKTTLLRCVAGLERPSSGRIATQRGVVFDSLHGLNLPPEARRIGMVFQSYALWPHMTVFDNVAYPLRARRMSTADIQSQVSRTLTALGIGDLARQYSAQLSGGQQQRVALARALIAGTDTVLFDEPLSNVDARVRDDLRNEIREMQLRLGFTAVYVTHDREEAMALGKRIAVIEHGRIAQIGTPKTIYGQPCSAHVARVLGATTEIAGSVRECDGVHAVVDTTVGAIRVSTSRHVPAGSEVLLVTRPVDWQISSGDGASSNCWGARIEEGTYLGIRNEYVMAVENLRVRVWHCGELLPQGTQVVISIPSHAIHMLDRAPEQARA
jgi:iron(III) transport system ATP-binding protein